ncbi:endonuclease/exonuclease/phosphatase family protein [Devosia sp. Leaf64]|uniref:endonuclease/exonuclease/phosphatase family protein n=1 Tax=Devosia sp. Leaf64 TaxID=1736229 RepID=UPI000AEF7604|nr:endonuclease/exonuclease/phosphatase family protein [Devosia sp. Leaf64]
MWSRAEFRGAVLALGGVLAVILIITSISPGIPGELLLQSLRFHLVALGLVLTVLMVIFGAKWRAALFFVFLCGAFAHGAFYVWEFQKRREVPVGALQAEFSYLNYNVLASNQTADVAAHYIATSGADVALIMETPGVVEYLPEIEAVLPYRLGCDRVATCDISLFSRFPIEIGEIRDIPPFRRARLAIAPMTVEGVKVTVVGIHLSKPYFDEASLQELGYLRYTLSKITGPIVLSGDFNAAAWSAPLAFLGRAQELIPPPTYRSTWPVEFGEFGVPIDNIFTKGDARIIYTTSGKDSFGSNHRYLFARIGLYAPL